MADDQRRRLQSAMAELTYERGYPSVTVRDLLARAHVTKPTFYRLYSGKDDCFARAYDETTTLALEFVEHATAGSDKRVEIVRRGVGSFVEAVLSRPGAAHLALLETLSVGPAATARMRRTEAEFVRLCIERLATADDPVALPPQIARGVVAGVSRLARERLKARPEILRADVAELTRWVVSVTDPAVEDLAGISVDHRTLKRDESRFDGDLRLPMSEERALLIRAVLCLAAEEGHDHLDPKKITVAAGLSRRSFDDEFAGLDDCFSRALEVGTVSLVADVRGVTEAAPDWSHGICRAMEALCGFFVSEPGFARLAFVGVFVPGRATTRRGSGILSAVARLLCDRTPVGLRHGRIHAEASVGAIWALLRREVAGGRVTQIRRLAPSLAWLVLAPSIGGPEAVRALKDAMSSHDAARS